MVMVSDVKHRVQGSDWVRPVGPKNTHVKFKVKKNIGNFFFKSQTLIQSEGLNPPPRIVICFSTGKYKTNSNFSSGIENIVKNTYF